MTTWANGDTITAAWMNSVEKVLALGTYGATTSPRLTLAPNSTFDLATNTVATNLTMSGSITVATGKQYEALGFRSLTSSVSGTGISTCMNFLHSATCTDVNSYAYLSLGQMTATSGAGKASGMYSRVVHGGAAFTGTINAFEAAISSVAGTVHGANSTLVALWHDTTDTSVSLPLGVCLSSNTAGAKVANPFVVLSTIDVTASVFQWNQRVGTAANLIQANNSAAAALFTVDYLGDIKFETTSHQIKNATTAYITFPTNGDLVLGKASAATGDTTGHIYIQSHAGAPTGVPAGQAGYSALRYDTTAHKIYVYDGGWKATAALT